MNDFLTSLREAASSSLALAAYVVAASAWVLRAWLLQRPQQKARAILTAFKSDAERNQALTKIVGDPPPANLKRDEILEWTRVKAAERTHGVLLIAYLATLLAIIVVVAMALFGNPSLKDATAEQQPVLTDVTVDRPVPAPGGAARQPGR